MEQDAQGQLPPLRPAALAVIPEGSDEQPRGLRIVPQKKIEEHEVEMYKEQDVRRALSLSLSSPSPSSSVRAVGADLALALLPSSSSSRTLYAYTTNPSFPPARQRYLPIANVGRIMKKCLPETTKVSKDAKECVQECTSEFISFITSEAAERCAVEKRKTINGEDILFAMSTLGFEMYAEVMKIYLAKYREHQRSIGKRAQKRGPKASAAPSSAGLPVGLAVAGDGDDAGEDDEEGDGEGYGESEGEME